MRYGKEIQTECDTLSEAVATASYEIRWNQAAPIRIECPNGTVIHRDYEKPPAEGSLDYMIKQKKKR